jgi:hypothetical protein
MIKKIDKWGQTAEITGGKGACKIRNEYSEAED